MSRRMKIAKEAFPPEEVADEIGLAQPEEPGAPVGEAALLGRRRARLLWCVLGLGR